MIREVNKRRRKEEAGRQDDQHFMQGTSGQSKEDCPIY